MADHTKAMHAVCLRVRTTAEEDRLMEKSFHALSHIHNVLVKHVKKLLVRLEHDREYQSMRNKYTAFLSSHKDAGKLSKAGAAYKKSLSDGMLAARREMGLSEYGLQSYIKVCAKQYNRLLSSQQVQKEATRVWRSAERYLFGDGKQVHFKKYMDFTTIGGKSNLNGMRFDKDSFTAVWMGHTYKIARPRKSSRDYVYEALSSEISYCEVKRRMFPAGWHYYINIILKGPAPKKFAAGDSSCGVDPGVSAMAAVSDDMVFLEELAPDIGRYNKKIAETLRHIDMSRRMSNPAKYKPDGTIDRGNHDRWVFSKTYIQLRRQLKYLYRAKSEYIKHSHNGLVNRLLKDARYFLVEEMDYRALAKRSKKTERSDKTSDVRAKDGTVKQVFKFKKKKRFGKSLNNRAPSQFLRQLEQKAAAYGGSVTRVPAKEFRASQYDHVTDTYTKIPLSQRDKVVGGHKVQRDLYSAFLILNADDTLKHPDRDRCSSTFEGFVERQDKLISQMKENDISMKQCFGF